MASTDKGKYVVLFTSGTFIFFKHKNDKGIYCPKSILNSSRQVLKDDIYELTTENVTVKHHKDYPDMPEAAVLIATRAKYLKTPRIIHGVGTMKKISQDGEYGFVEYQDGRNVITAFCTRITVRPAIDKGGMLKFFATGGKVRFVAKEQPPSGMFNIEWRVVTATDMKHEISETNFEKVTPVSASVPARPTVAAAAAPAARPAAPVVQPTVAAAASAAVPAAPPGLPPVAAAQMNGGGVSASSSSSSVANGISYAARASQQLPDAAVVAAVHRANSGSLGSTQMADENLPMLCPDPGLFRLNDQERSDLLAAKLVLKPGETDEQAKQAVYDKWPHYKKDEERTLEAFEAELSQLSHVATALYGGDHHVCPIFFASRVS